MVFGDLDDVLCGIASACFGPACTGKCGSHAYTAYASLSANLLVCAGGGITFDAAANKRKYGSHMSPADVLCGEVDPPADMETFYEELSALSLFAAPHIEP